MAMSSDFSKLTALMRSAIAQSELLVGMLESVAAAGEKDQVPTTTKEITAEENEEATQVAAGSLSLVGDKAITKEYEKRFGTDAGGIVLCLSEEEALDYEALEKVFTDSAPGIDLATLVISEGLQSISRGYSVKPPSQSKGAKADPETRCASASAPRQPGSPEVPGAAASEGTKQGKV